MRTRKRGSEAIFSACEKAWLREAGIAPFCCRTHTFPEKYGAEWKVASYPGLQRGGKAWYTLSAHARNYILRDVNRWAESNL